MNERIADDLVKRERMKFRHGKKGGGGGFFRQRTEIICKACLSWLMQDLTSHKQCTWRGQSL